MGPTLVTSDALSLTVTPSPLASLHKIFAKCLPSISIKSALDYLAILMVIFISTVSVECLSAQTRIPGDFNNDGYSDITVISTDRTLVWNRLDAQTGTPIGALNLGVVGDHVIMADWMALGRPQIGVTRVERGSRFIVWRVQDSRGLIQELQFGDAGDTVIAGIDVDNSGAADAIIARRMGRKYTFYIRLDPFLGGTTMLSYEFATTADSLFFLDVDGTGIKLAAKTKGKTSNTLKLLNPLSGEVKIYRNLPKEGTAQKYKFSMPLLSPSGKEVVATVSTKSRRTVITLVDPTKKLKKGKTPQALTIKGGGDTVYGNFLPNPGFEIAVKTADGVLIANPFDGTQKRLPTPNGVLVDELNINLLKATSSVTPPAQRTPPPTSQPTPRPDTPTIPAEPPSGGLASVCTSTSAISPGQLLVKSEISNHIHGGDPRATGYTVVCAAQCPSARSYVPFYYSDGVEAGAVGYYGTFSGNGRPRLYGAASDAPQHFVSDIAPKASQDGRNGKLYLSMGNGSCKEFNPVGRNGSL